MKKVAQAKNSSGTIVHIDLERVAVDELGRIELEDQSLKAAVGRIKSRRLKATKAFPKPPSKPRPGPVTKPKPKPAETDSMCNCVAGCGCGPNNLCKSCA